MNKGINKSKKKGKEIKKTFDRVFELGGVSVPLFEFEFDFETERVFNEIWRFSTGRDSGRKI